MRMKQIQIIVQVTKYQIIIIDGSITYSHRFHQEAQEGRLHINIFQSGPSDFVNFYSMYGIPMGSVVNVSRHMKTFTVNLIPQ